MKRFMNLIVQKLDSVGVINSLTICEDRQKI